MEKQLSMNKIEKTVLIMGGTAFLGGLAQIGFDIDTPATISLTTDGAILSSAGALCYLLRNAYPINKK